MRSKGQKLKDAPISIFRLDLCHSSSLESSYYPRLANGVIKNTKQTLVINILKTCIL